MIVGLKDCPPDLRDLIGKKAAIDLLTVLGAAFRPGMGSVSLSRDGVSSSMSLLNTQKYGIYNSTINVYKEYLKDELPRLKAKYRGSCAIIV
jgi:hypothetical protein